MPRRKVAVKTPAGNTATIAAERLAELEADGADLRPPNVDPADEAVSELLAVAMGDRYLFTKGFGWMEYETNSHGGGRWRPSSDVSAIEFAKLWVRARHEEACERGRR